MILEVFMPARRTYLYVINNPTPRLSIKVAVVRRYALFIDKNFIEFEGRWWIAYH